MAIIKRKIWCWVRIRWKKAKKFNQKKFYRPKTVTHSDKSVKTKFFCYFFADNFFAWVFLQLFQRIRNQHHILHFYFIFFLYLFYLSAWCLCLSDDKNPSIYTAIQRKTVQGRGARTVPRRFRQLSLIYECRKERFWPVPDRHMGRWLYSQHFAVV